MDCILTLVSSDKERPLSNRHLLEVEQCLPMKIRRISWLSAGKAADVHLSAWPDRGVCLQLESLFARDRLDFFIVPDDQTRRKMLLVADMDNTMVVGETIDELAAQCGLKGKIAAITDQAMRGELDFQTALRRRVAMLENLPEEAL